MNRLRLCSFNVRYDTPEDTYSWKRRRKSVREVLYELDADIICLQEALFSQVVDIESDLGGFDWVGVGRLGGNDGEFCPIGWRPGQFRLLDAETRWLSDQPATPGSIGWDATFPRIATRIRLAIGEKILSIWNTHLDHEGSRARIEAARLLHRWVKDEPHTVLVGDFNCEPESEPYRQLTTDLDDARAVATRVHGPSGTFHEFTTDPGPAIDHLFVTESIEIKRFETVSSSPDNIPPSDHFPVIADLRIPTE